MQISLTTSDQLIDLTAVSWLQLAEWRLIMHSRFRILFQSRQAVGNHFCVRQSGVARLLIKAEQYLVTRSAIVHHQILIGSVSDFGA